MQPQPPKPPARKSLALCHALALPPFCQSAAPVPEKREPAYQGKPLSHWLKLLRERPAPAHTIAFDPLREIGEPAAPALAKMLEDQDSQVRVKAAAALSFLGPKARAAVPALARALVDETIFVRVAAAVALGEIGPEAKDAVPALTKALDGKDPMMKGAAAKSLGMIGPPARAAVPALTLALKDPALWVASDAAGALWRIDPRNKVAVPALIDMLRRGERVTTRSNAARVLGE